MKRKLKPIYERYMVVGDHRGWEIQETITHYVFLALWMVERQELLLQENCRENKVNWTLSSRIEEHLREEYFQAIIQQRNGRYSLCFVGKWKRVPWLFDG